MTHGVVVGDGTGRLRTEIEQRRARLIQGQGDATEIKQRGLSFAFRIGLTVMARRPRWRYFHLDLHAGSGFNEQAKCIGSPLTFLNEAGRVNCENYFACFCDRDDTAIKSLLQYPELQDRRCWIFHGDNVELPSIMPDIVARFNENRKYATGSVLSDPNGADVPLDALSQLANDCPRLDVIFHWNSTITKRLRYGIKPEQITLEMVPRLVRKRFWLIRKPATPHQFTILIGRNMPTGDYRSLGFYHLDSAEGQDILERCSISLGERESRRQETLFDASL